MHALCKKALFLHDQSSSAISDTRGIFIRFCLSQLFANRQEPLIHVLLATSHFSSDLCMRDYIGPLYYGLKESRLI